MTAKIYDCCVIGFIFPSLSRCRRKTNNDSLGAAVAIAAANPTLLCSGRDVAEEVATTRIARRGCACKLAALTGANGSTSLHRVSTITSTLVIRPNLPSNHRSRFLRIEAVRENAQIESECFVAPIFPPPPVSTGNIRHIDFSVNTYIFLRREYLFQNVINVHSVRLSPSYIMVIYTNRIATEIE